MPAVAQPSTPPARPKSAAKSAVGKSPAGAPLGTKKTTPAPFKKATPKPENVEASAQSTKETVEEPHTPVQEQGNNQDEEVKPDPPELDEAIDVGDNDDPERSEEGGEDDKTEETETNVEPSEIDPANVEEPSEIGEAEEHGEEAVEGIEHPEENAEHLDEHAEPIEENAEHLEDGAEQATDLGESVDEQATDLGEQVDEHGEPLEEGAEKVEEGAEQVGENGEPLEEGAEKVKENGEPLEEGAEKVKENGEPLEEGAEKVGENGEPLEEGAEKVGENGEPLEDGAQKLGENGEPLEGAEGATELSEPTILGDGNEEKDGEELEVPIDLSILEGKKVNKSGLIVDEEGNPFGKLIEGDPKKLAGKKVDAEGRIWNDSGKIIGKAELLPEEEREPPSSAPFEDFPDAVVDASGAIMFEGRKIGIVTEGDAKKLAGKKIDADGDIVDKHGNVIGKAIREDEEEPEPEVEPEEVKIDCSMLAGLRVNKAGNLVGDNGKLVGRVVEGSLKSLIGKTSDGEGNIHNEVGKVIGRAEPIPENEREENVEAPFEDFPGAIVEKTGNVLYEGKIIGRVIEGDAKKLAGKTVDPEGDIVDKNGTVLGKAERWEEEEPEEVPEEVIDMSILAGKRVNKSGNIVDSSGTIYGRLVEGDVKSLAGRMCDKQGFVRNESGDVVGKAELVSEGDREGLKTGPFADFPGSTVAKEGKVVYGETVVGKLIEGDEKKLFGKAVDDDGDVLDKNGNVVGKAERWEEEEKQKDVHPLSGLKVNKKGELYNLDGELVGKLTEGEVSRCAGQKVDDDGDVVDQKGTSIGHVSLIEDIPEPEPEPEVEVEEETEEEKAARLEAEEDKKLAIRMSSCIQSSLDKIQPVLKRITELTDQANAAKKEDLDEDKLVNDVKPLIEEGGRILTECNGAIRGLDPDGRIAEKAKARAAAREATPEEYHLADLLKELTGNVTTTIDNAKKKIANMPHAKKELNPLWGLLAEPLFQILAAVGLLLSGVLGLVSQLLNGLGLGGLVRGLLGGLGITRVLDGLGIGKLLSPITGSKK